MNATHYEKIRELFVRALDVPVEDREAWLLTTAEGDRDLVADVRDLLDTVDESSAFLETPALGAAFRDDVSRPPQDEPTLPPELASFTDLQPLGSGGFAHVWSARQKGPFERRVAIKVLRHDLGDGDALGRFQVEQRTLARMEHPSIAKVFESGVTGDGRPYYVMELVDGPPLTEYADRHELGTRERVRLWRDVCIAVRHAHARGVIHRDLKPSNVLVTEVDRVPVVKVIDFGIAKDVRSDLDADPITREGSFLGSLAYTSPEQLHADASVADARSDVYALGVLGFELLAGRRPHEARSLAEFVRLATERDATRLRDVDRRFRGDLDWITARALERDPSLRYGTASELASDLEAWLDGRPIRVRAAHPGYFVGRMIRRYRVAIAMLALVIAVTIAAFAVHVRALRDEALHRLGQVEMLVEAWRRQLASLPGARDARRAWLEGLLATTTDMVERFQDEERAIALHATVLVELGDIELQDGRREAAFALYREARDRRERVARDGAPERLADLSIAIVKCGDAYGELGEPARRIEAYERALAIDRELAAAHPNARRYRDNLAWSYERVAHLLGRAGDVKRADTLRGRRHALALELVDEFPAAAPSWHNLAVSHLQLADAIADADRDQARMADHAERALEAIEHARDLEPENGTYRLVEAGAARSAARSRRELGDTELAIAFAERSLVCVEMIVEVAPDDLEALVRLVQTREELADLHVATGNVEAALELEFASLEPAREAVRRRPLRDATHNALCRTLVACRKHAIALERTHVAADIEREIESAFEAWHTAMPSSVTAHEHRATYLAEVPTTTRDLEEAVRHTQRAIELAPQAQPRLRYLLAERLAAAGRIADARATIEAARLDPETPDALRLELEALLEALPPR